MGARSRPPPENPVTTALFAFLRNLATPLLSWLA